MTSLDTPEIKQFNKFRVIPENKLNETEFEYFPVWSEHYDWDEIEDIERWGLNKEEVLELFRKNENGSTHCCYTLLESNPFPSRMRIFIKAKLMTRNGMALKGYIMNEDAYCLGIFYEGKQYYFSCHPMLSDLFNEEAKRLGLAMGIKSHEIFPVSYETDFFDNSGNKIAGQFNLII